MTANDGGSENDGKVKEEQYITSMMSNLKTNDLKSFNNYMKNNYEQVKNDISTIKYSYSIDPLIYTIDSAQKLAKLNPSNLFNSMFGGSSMLNMYTSYASIFSQMIDDKDALNDSYDLLAGHWPENYNEMIIVLSEPNSISDLLVYSLGLRDTEELNTMITKIMSGETVDIKNEPLTFTYEDLMNVDLRLINPADTFKYNDRYGIYEDMSNDKDYMQNLYNNAVKLKIVGVVSGKEGVSSMALNPGVAYTGDLIDYIINYSKDTDIVKKQLENPEIDVVSGARFDSEDENNLGLDFADLVSIDKNKLQSAFNVKISEQDLQKQMQDYMAEITSSVSTDTSKAYKDFTDGLNTMANEMVNNNDVTKINKENVDTTVENYLNGYTSSNIISKLEEQYLIPKENLKMIYSGMLKGLLQIYANINEIISPLIGENSEPINIEITQETIDNLNAIIPDLGNKISKFITDLKSFDIKSIVLSSYLNSTAIQGAIETISKVMTEAVMKKDVLTKVGELTGNLTNQFASSFNVDQNKIASAFQLKITEDEIKRIVNAVMSQTQKNMKTNLILFGYQDKEEPTYISYYFSSFDGKEHFMNFIDEYNNKVIQNGEEDKEIKYTDTTGILMNSVKIIVSAVTYVLIAFVSISLVVSSIMIGIITYISVYERTKEIGILRAIGASKHNISSIFNAETFIIGLLSGLFGIGITYILIPIINAILHHYTGNIPLSAVLNPNNAITLVVLSIILTLIGGLIPAKKASKKDPVIALRTE